MFELHALMCRTSDNVKLLLRGEINEFDSISRNADCEVCVFRLFGMFHAILELIYAKHVDIEVMSALVKVAVQHMPEVVDAFLFGVAESIRADGLSIGNTVKRILIRQLCNRIQRSKQSVLLGTLGRISTGSKWGERFTSVRSRSGCLAVNHI